MEMVGILFSPALFKLFGEQANLSFPDNFIAQMVPSLALSTNFGCLRPGWQESEGWPSQFRREIKARDQPLFLKEFRDRIFLS